MAKSKGSMSNDETEDDDNAHANEMDIEESKPNLKRRKVASEESIIKDNDNKAKKIRMSEYQGVTDQRDDEKDVESEQTSNNNHNKIAGKKRRRVTTNDTNIVEDVEKKVIKVNESATKSDNKEEKLKDLNKNNSSNEPDTSLETKQYPMMNSDDNEEKGDGEERETESKKKKRKRNRNKIHQQDVMCNIGLQIMAKPDWKRLRNRYLELQRNKMGLLKQHLKKAEVGRGEIIKNRPNYDKSKREKDNGKTGEAEKSVYGCAHYVPGVIVKIEMDEPCTDLRSFKVCQF